MAVYTNFTVATNYCKPDTSQAGAGGRLKGPRAAVSRRATPKAPRRLARDAQFPSIPHHQSPWPLQAGLSLPSKNPTLARIYTAAHFQSVMSGGTNNQRPVHLQGFLLGQEWASATGTSHPSGASTPLRFWNERKAGCTSGDTHTSPGYSAQPLLYTYCKLKAYFVIINPVAPIGTQNCSQHYTLIVTRFSTSELADSRSYIFQTIPLLNKRELKDLGAKSGRVETSTCLLS